MINLKLERVEKDMTQLNNDNYDVSIMSTDTDCLEGIREALKIAMLTDQIVEVGLNCFGEPEVVEGLIIEVCSRTFCIKIEDSRRIQDRGRRCEHDEILKYDIENVEYVEFC